MDIRQFALPDKHGPLDCFLTVDWDGTVSVWSFLERKRLTTIKTCYDYGGKRLAVDWAGRCLVAASFKTGHVECFSVEGQLLWERKYKHPQFVSWIPALSSWSVTVDAGNDFLIRQSGKELSVLKGVERGFPLGCKLFMGVKAKALAIFDESLGVQSTLKKESFAVVDCDFRSGLVAVAFAGAGVVLSDLKEKSWLKCPPLIGLPSACVLATRETVYALSERSGEGREVASYSMGEANWRILIKFPWLAGRGDFAESGRYFLSHHAGVWDVAEGTCVWDLEGVTV